GRDDLELIVFDGLRDDRRRARQKTGLDLGVGLRRCFQVWPGLLDRRTNRAVEHADLHGDRLRLDRRIEGPASAVDQHQYRRLAEHDYNVIDVGYQIVGLDVAGHAANKQMPDGLIEDELDRHAGIGAG